MPCCSSQKLCNAGEREWATGKPMMPASRVLPVTLIAASSTQHNAALAQEAEQLDERQAQNGEVVAGNPREQLHPPPFETIGADRSEQRLALGRNIPLKEGAAQPPHVQFRSARRMPHPSLALHA